MSKLMNDIKQMELALDYSDALHREVTEYRKKHNLAPFQEFVEPEHLKALAEIEKKYKKCDTATAMWQLCDLVDTLNFQVTELRLALTDSSRGVERLSRIIGVDIPRPLTELERLEAELVEDLHDNGMTDEEIKQRFFYDGQGGVVSLFKEIEEAKDSDSKYKDTLLRFDAALSSMIDEEIKARGIKIEEIGQ